MKNALHVMSTINLGVHKQKGNDEKQNFAAKPACGSVALSFVDRTALVATK
jgi:hypothetical protein